MDGTPKVGSWFSLFRDRKQTVLKQDAKMGSLYGFHRHNYNTSKVGVATSASPPCMMHQASFNMISTYLYGMNISKANASQFVVSHHMIFPKWLGLGSYFIIFTISLLHLSLCQGYLIMCNPIHCLNQSLQTLE